MGIAPFIDTNILIYHVLHEHPDHSRRCSELLIQLGAGNGSARSSATVIFETVCFLENRRQVPRADIFEPVRDILNIPAIAFGNRAALLDALDFWRENSPPSFADCYHRALTSHLGSESIYAFDKKMGRYPGVPRLEP